MASTTKLLDGDGMEKWEVDFQATLKRMTPASPFFQDFQLAIRGATFVLLMGVWLILPHRQDIEPPSLNSFQKNVALSCYDSSVPVLFVYTLTYNTGSTIYLGWTGLIGTIWSAFLGYFIFLVYPEGVTEMGWNGPVIFITIIGVTVTFMTLYLNLSRNVQVFLLSNYVFHWMAFLVGNPAAYCGRQWPWDCIGDSKAQDGHFWRFASSTAEVKTICLAFSAVILAIAATYFPWPLLAIKQARSSAVRVTDALCTAWESCVDTYCDERLVLRKQDRVVHDMHRLSHSVGKMQASIADAWWECFGWGSIQRSRIMLTRFDAIIKENYDRLQCALANCASEDFAGCHTQLMHPLKNDVKNLMSKAKELYAYSIAATLDGTVDAEEEKRMTVLIAETKEAIHIFSEKFRRTKREKIQKLLDKDLLEEHAFCYNVCVFARLAHEFAADLIKFQNGEPCCMAHTTERGSFKDIFDPKINNVKENLSFAFRNTLSILIGMYIGYRGFFHEMADGTWQPILDSGSAGIACTACLLLSNSAGSALLKNLGRVQGVVLAAVLGQLMFGLFGKCHAVFYVTLSTLLWVWLVGTLFIYYHSSQYGFIGMLLAAFGTGYLLLGCDVEGFDPVQTSYSNTTGVVVCIAVMCVVDMIFAGRRASKLAHIDLVKCFKDIARRLDILTDPAYAATEFNKTRGQLAAHISVTANMGREAALEPRFHRTAWRETLFNQAVDTAKTLRRNLVAMEMSAAESGHLENDKSPVFMHMVKNMPTVRTIVLSFAESLAKVQDILEIFRHEKDTDINYSDLAPFTAALRKLHDGKIEYIVLKEFNAAWVDSDNKSETDHPYGAKVRELLPLSETDHPHGAKVRELLGLPANCDHLANLSLENDPTCQVAFLISCLNSMLDSIWSLQHEILQA